MGNTSKRRKDAPIYEWNPVCVIPKKDDVGDVSTVHISLKDSLKLDKGDVPYQIGTFEYGYIVLTHQEGSKRDKELKKFGMSDAYVRLLHTAAENGHYYLMIDRDGPVIKGLDQFDW